MNAEKTIQAANQLTRGLKEGQEKFKEDIDLKIVDLNNSIKETASNNYRIIIEKEEHFGNLKGNMDNLKSTY